LAVPDEAWQPWRNGTTYATATIHNPTAGTYDQVQVNNSMRFELASPLVIGPDWNPVVIVCSKTNRKETQGGYQDEVVVEEP
jgi:hypothetical protein